MSGSPETRGLLLLFGILRGMDILVLPLVSVGKFVPLRPFKPVVVGVIVSKQIEKKIRYKDKQDFSKTD